MDCVRPEPDDTICDPACGTGGGRRGARRTRAAAGGRSSTTNWAKRDKLNPDLLWLRDRALAGSGSLPEPEVLAAEIVEDLRAALEAFQTIAQELESTGNGIG